MKSTEPRAASSSSRAPEAVGVGRELHGELRRGPHGVKAPLERVAAPFLPGREARPDVAHGNHRTDGDLRQPEREPERDGPRPRRRLPRARMRPGFRGAAFGRALRALSHEPHPSAASPSTAIAAGAYATARDPRTHGSAAVASRLPAGPGREVGSGHDRGIHGFEGRRQRRSRRRKAPSHRARSTPGPSPAPSCSTR